MIDEPASPTSGPPEDPRSGGHDLADVQSALLRAAADLDYIRSLGNLIPRRVASLRTAAAVLRSIANGELSAAIIETLIKGGAQSPCSSETA